MRRIDDIIRDSVDGKSPDYSKAHWGEMEKLLDNEPKKRGFFYRSKYLLLGLFVVGIGGAISFFLVPTNSINTKINTNDQELIDNNNNNSMSIFDKKDNHNNINSSFSNDNSRKHKDGIQSKNSIPILNNWSNSKDSIQKKYVKEIGVNENTQMENQTTKSSVSMNVMPTMEFTLPIVPKLVIKKPSLLPNNARIIFEIKKLENKEKFKNKYKIWTYFIGGYLESQKHNQQKYSQSLEQKNTEKLTNSLESGIEFTVKKNKMAFKFALGNRNIQSNSNYTSQVDSWNYETSLRLVKRNYIPNGNGKPIALLVKQVDSTLVGTNTLIRCPNCITNFNYLTIPITVQYELKRKRWIGYGELGIKSNILLNTSGLYTSINKNEVVEELSISKEAQNFFINGRIGLGAKYQLRNRLFIYGNYGYEIGLSSMTRSYSQKLNSNMMKFGLEFRL